MTHRRRDIQGGTEEEREIEGERKKGRGEIERTEKLGTGGPRASERRDSAGQKQADMGQMEAVAGRETGGDRVSLSDAPRGHLRPPGLPHVRPRGASSAPTSAPPHKAILGVQGRTSIHLCLCVSTGEVCPEARASVLLCIHPYPPISTPCPPHVLGTLPDPVQGCWVGPHSPQC